MPNQGRRSRSTTSASTKASQRPLSRASTTSLQSQTTQDQHSNDFQQPYPQHAIAQPQQHMGHQAQSHMQYAPVDQSLLQAAHSLGHQDNMMMLQYQQHAAPQMIPQHSQETYAHPPPNPYMHLQQQASDYGNSNPAAAASGAETDDKKKKGASASATNDKELREMLTRADGRSLKEVAEEVLRTERTSRAEKSKQLFAMLWLRQTCKHAKTSVPRNRVYSQYADRCATERVQPLNPASFGKLVRVIFPGIATRRLGVRGESKYHYVDLALVDDPVDGHEVERAGSAHSQDFSHTRQGSTHLSIDFNNMPRLPADTAVFPAQEQPTEPQQKSTETGRPSFGRAFAEPYVPGYGSARQTSSTYEQQLKFPPPDQESFQENDSIELPNIHDYVPPKTDIDAANALTALYRTHCTSLVDCIRFCKEKQFFRLFTSFHGTLTVPVQKLLAHPSMAIWIRECDWLMYQKMIRFVSRLTLQVTPPVVLNFLNNISRELHKHISKTFQGHPLHVLEARLEPATLFAQLLHRMLRANQAAHAAAALLMIDQNRNQMWMDWVTYVNPKRVMESELPNCGYEETYKILTQDVRSLLLPLSTPVWLENGTHYQEAALQAARQHGDSPITNETVIDRLANFLSNLGTRFPNADARTLLHCISAVGTAACREITVENGASFSPWWITKVFVDELSLWLASLGGFLAHRAPERKRMSSQLSPMEGSMENRAENGGAVRGNSQDESRFSSLAADFSVDTSFMSSQVKDESGNDMNARNAQESFNQNKFQSFGMDFENQDLDDSGIGMSLMDDNIGTSKGYIGADASNNFTHGGMNVR
ncbi:Protein sak1 [Lasiodiplodia hormozganensis]|uniref:Protein sak1 n=1 Tax=Lasiodiplodia hormozganensis TaxID=869390 RepID=A0AA40D6X1_9PEZI|nr:Protein sak1 [Lasiodiplodia hormozganensis]